MGNLPFVASIASVAFGLAFGFWLEPSLSSEVRIASFSSTWPVTRGTVLSAQSLHFGNKSGYRAAVTFAYEVSHRQYTGAQTLCVCADPTSADDALRNFPKGTQHSVFYDPVNPSLSVVRPRDFDAAFFSKWGLEVTMIVLFVAVLPLTLWVLGSKSAPTAAGEKRPSRSHGNAS